MTLCGKVIHVSFKAQGRLLVLLRLIPLSKHYSAFKGKKTRHFLHAHLTCSKVPNDLAAMKYNIQTGLGSLE